MILEFVVGLLYILAGHLCNTHGHESMWFFSFNNILHSWILFRNSMFFLFSLTSLFCCADRLTRQEEIQCGVPVSISAD